MSNLPPQRETARAAPHPPRRQIAVPGAPQQRRTGLLLLGVLLVAGAGFGSWYAFQSVDQRSEYLVAVRTINRWEQVSPADFTVVEANVGAASALTTDRLGNVLGKWTTGRIPAGTLVTEGLFETPPLSGSSDADRVLIQVSLPSSEAPFGSLETGDTVALLGAEASGVEGEPGPLGLIGVLTLEFVQDESIYYIVAPEDALDIKETVDRFTRSTDRTIWKMGINLTADDIGDVLDESGASVPAALLETFNDPGSDLGSVEEQ